LAGGSAGLKEPREGQKAFRNRKFDKLLKIKGLYKYSVNPEILDISRRWRLKIRASLQKSSAQKLIKSLNLFELYKFF